MKFLDMLNPYRWILLLALCGSLVVGYYGWRSHQRGIGEHTVQVKWDKQTAVLKLAADKATAENEANEKAWADAATKAKNEADKRAKTLQSNAAAARAESRGLRDDLAAARSQMSGSTCDSVRAYAATVGQLFGECSGAIEELAQKASSHTSDLELIMSAWPSNGPTR